MVCHHPPPTQTTFLIYALSDFKQSLYKLDLRIQDDIQDDIQGAHSSDRVLKYPRVSQLTGVPNYQLGGVLGFYDYNLIPNSQNNKGCPYLLQVNIYLHTFIKFNASHLCIKFRLYSFLHHSMDLIVTSVLLITSFPSLV